MYVMETIFDHNITAEEHYALIGNMTKERFLTGLDENSSNVLLAELYRLRENEKKMMEYVNKLPNHMKYDFLRIISPLD